MCMFVFSILTLIIFIFFNLLVFALKIRNTQSITRLKKRFHIHAVALLVVSYANYFVKLSVVGIHLIWSYSTITKTQNWGQCL